MIRHSAVSCQRLGDAYIMRRAWSRTGAKGVFMDYVDSDYSSTVTKGAARPPLKGSVDAEVCVVGGGPLGVAAAQLSYWIYALRDAFRHQFSSGWHST